MYKGIRSWWSNLFATDDIPTSAGSVVGSHDLLSFFVVFASEGEAVG
jgi:hypothetical protein